VPTAFFLFWYSTYRIGGPCVFTYTTPTGGGYQLFGRTISHLPLSELVSWGDVGIREKSAARQLQVNNLHNDQHYRKYPKSVQRITKKRGTKGPPHTLLTPSLGMYGSIFNAEVFRYPA